MSLRYDDYTAKCEPGWGNGVELIHTMRYRRPALPAIGGKERSRHRIGVAGKGALEVCVITNGPTGGRREKIKAFQALIGHSGGHSTPVLAAISGDVEHRRFILLVHSGDIPVAGIRESDIGRTLYPQCTGSLPGLPAITRNVEDTPGRVPGIGEQLEHAMLCINKGWHPIMR